MARKKELNAAMSAAELEAMQAQMDAENKPLVPEENVLSDAELRDSLKHQVASGPKEDVFLMTGPEITASFEDFGIKDGSSDVPIEQRRLYLGELFAVQVGNISMRLIEQAHKIFGVSIQSQNFETSLTEAQLWGALCSNGGAVETVPEETVDHLIQMFEAAIAS